MGAPHDGDDLVLEREHRARVRRLELDVLIAVREAEVRLERGQRDHDEVVEVSADLVMSGQAVADATDVIRTFIGEHGPATVSELRQALSTSRRIVVPLLEYLDRTFVTLRQGDRRALRRRA